MSMLNRDTMALNCSIIQSIEGEAHGYLCRTYYLHARS